MYHGYTIEMVETQVRICLEDKILWDFEIQTDNVIRLTRPDLKIIDKENRTYQLLNLVVPTDLRLKIKEKRD